MRVWIILLLLVPTAAFADQRSPAELRQICADAMNADKSFADSIVATVNAQTAKEHQDAADDVARNERHVVLAYAAMWLVAAGFLVFMWRRQQTLKSELATLRRELDAATKEAAK